MAATLFTLSGFTFVESGSAISTPTASTLSLVGSDDLQVVFTPTSADGSEGILSVAQGEIFEVSVDGSPLSLPGEVTLDDVSFEGQSGEFLTFESDLAPGRSFVFPLSGDLLAPGDVPSQAELAEIIDGATIGPITSGPFAAGTPFAPAAITGVEVDDDPLGGSDDPDVINGFNSADAIDGGAGADQIDGGFGNDTILGGTGQDTIRGGGGNDDINSGPGGGDDAVADGDLVDAGGGLDVIRGSVADLDEDTISGLDFGDRIVIEGVSESAVTVGSGTVSIDTDGDGTAEAGFAFGAVGAAAAADLVARQDGDDVVLELDPAEADTPGIGTTIAGPEDFSDIADVLFADDSIVPIDLYYVGAVESLALLEDGFAISEISGESPQEVVGIDRGVFLSSGGGPGTENTQDRFTVFLNEPGDPRLDQTAQEAFENAGASGDASLITFTFDAADLGDQSAISFDVIFASDEFPEFQDSSFVDIGAIYVNGVNYALFNNDPGQPLSIVGDSINTPGNFFDNDEFDEEDSPGRDGVYDTEYDGFSVLLNVIAPVQAGINTVTIAVADTGDLRLDSGLFVGNVQGTDFATGGSFVQTNGTGGDDAIEANGAPQLISLGGGADTVTGTADELDGDVISGFGEDDVLAFEDAEFDEDDLTVTLGSAILDIDTDGDGEDDTTVTLQGNFAGASFDVSQQDDTTVITAQNLPNAGIEETGTEAADTLVGTTGDDTLSGEDGDDRLEGLEGNDALDGGEGADGIIGGDGDDVISGGDGADNIASGAGDDVADGEGGDDLMGGGTGNDALSGGDGDDFMGGGLGDDTVDGGEGGDVVNGGGGDDVLIGGAGDDTMGGSFNADEVTGGQGDDDMGGGLGQDTLAGGAGNDRAGGGEGDDVVNGGAGDDFLAGGGRNDAINGGAGDDTINGGDGEDDLTGGDGADLFVFNRGTEGVVDEILDFEVGIDRIRLTGIEGADDQAKFDSLTITEGDLGTGIQYDGQTIGLFGITADQIGADDFVFV